MRVAKPDQLADEHRGADRQDERHRDFRDDEPVADAPLRRRSSCCGCSSAVAPTASPARRRARRRRQAPRRAPGLRRADRQQEREHAPVDARSRARAADSRPRPGPVARFPMSQSAGPPRRRRATAPGFRSSVGARDARVRRRAPIGRPLPWREPTSARARDSRRWRRPAPGGAPRRRTAGTGRGGSAAPRPLAPAARGRPSGPELPPGGLLLEPTGNCLQLALGRGQRHSWLQPAGDAAYAADRPRVPLERLPQIGARFGCDSGQQRRRAVRKLKRGRHDADDRHRLIVERQRRARAPTDRRSRRSRQNDFADRPQQRACRSRRTSDRESAGTPSISKNPASARTVITRSASSRRFQ